jgi:CBS domain-containing protein
MGRHDVTPDLAPQQFRAFTRALLTDVRALDHMIREGMFETEIRRMGAEQEVFLVNRGWRPASVATQVLEQLEQKELTTELALFNLEMNLDPLVLEAGCFRRLEDMLTRLIGLVRDRAHEHRAEVVLTGILPTLSKSDLSLENMTPRDRYYALNEALRRTGSGRYQIYIQGTDELHIQHDSVMFEGCNTSFQLHLQVEPSEFAHLHNIAQAIAAPVLSAAVNSPLLFGKRLWAETRIALFQRSIDTRGATPHLRDVTPRVRFGEGWTNSSVVELFHEDIARIPALLGAEIDQDPFQVLEEGGVPDLRALQLYNSTVYQWNRPCYGVTNGKPHLRIECRVLPAGPSVADEVANSAFWIGLMLGGLEDWGDVRRRMDFDDARANFVAAARRGLKAGFTWMGGPAVSAPELILEELLPVAHQGLEHAGIESDERNRYLGIIEARVRSGHTGAWWLENSLAGMGRSGTRSERMAALTASTARQQQAGIPAHEWVPATIGEGGGWRYNYRRVEQFMTTDLFTVKEDEVVDLAALVMDWKRVRQIPVEDDQRRLVGLVSYGAVLRKLAGCQHSDESTVPVKEIMDRRPITIVPETPTLDAIRLMRAHRITCLPVVKQEQLVGILTADDLVPIAERLLEEKMEEE